MTTVASLDELVRLVEAEPDLFLRYSPGPHQDALDGPSCDAEAQVTMTGWSATPLGPEGWWTRSTRDWVARRVTKYVEFADESGRRPWVLRGEVIGRGPDHEPLVDSPVLVAWLDDRVLDEADQHYTSAFDRGRASSEIWD